jgi:uncharacterized protein YndB with AHSA1/START domain
MPTSTRATVTLPTDEEILITREFDAPPPLVYKAWTTPELVRRWWSGRRGTMTVAEIDLRVGGAWRYAMTAHGGFEVAFHGEFRELVPGARVVNTEIYEGPPESEPALNVITFDPSTRGGTALTMVIRCTGKEMRDAIIDSGMEGGLQEGLDLLEEVAAGLQER